ncbi:cysteine hydrolase [Roseomonas sp. NAR14]|uniref:Cysteine hydrolase n=1 Tax=Roseomonas acroporae TaxID=2937791 RepID=A0A9X1Y7K4_9PROT|nr:cysteine hydrolase [Roseomonas acroporae]MCK8784600.1 cysteine hydrolase [Roseomonas acroporae]
MTATGTLRYGALSDRTVHLCVDMQNLFAERTEWHTPWMARVLPVLLRLARARPADTVFTRFIPPASADEMRGSWRRYYERWAAITRDRLAPRLLELVPPLAALVPPALVIDKRTYSPWTQPELRQALEARGCDTLVISGAETDVCVLAAVLGAVDHGYRVVLATDALCSSSDRTHDALLGLYNERYSQQIEAVPTGVILEAWH